MKTFMSDSSLGWMHGSDGDAGTVQNINAGIVNHQPMIASSSLLLSNDRFIVIRMKGLWESIIR
jgi:hypothetical protein